jgi:hypothetical protein
MGDRCYMHITCRRQDRELFEKIGFHVEFDESPDSPLIDMEDTEANYAHCGDMPGNVPYFGHHDAGGEYSDGLFACDGRRCAEVEAGHCGGFVVAWDTKRSRPDPQSLRRIRRYLEVQNKVGQMFTKLSTSSKSNQRKESSHGINHSLLAPGAVQ